ncbi:phage gene 29 protein family protein [Nocardia grenadensis]|uniref:phage gene 29 protein family protein n=1 Tax=Nocardia grenadensis TaxID=931537 RepID=UPI003D707F80
MSSRFPTYESCQPAEGEEPDPREIFQWALTALPFSGATPLIVQPQIRPEWSELFWKLGFRHHPELQTHRVDPPPRGQQTVLNGAVSVVEKDAPKQDLVKIPDPLKYTPHEQAVMAERLYWAGALRDKVPQSEATAAEEGSMDEFNPADHSPSTVNGYLMAAKPAERRRVVAAEMTGKRRDQILRKWADV